MNEHFHISIKKSLFLFLLGLLLCLPVFLLAAPSPPPLPKAEEVPTLRVGYTTTPGQFFQDESGLYNGMTFEYLSTVTSYMGCAMEFQEGTLEENLKKLRTGELDLVPTEEPLAEEGLASIPLGPSIGYAVLPASAADRRESMEKAVHLVDSLSPFYRMHLLEKFRPSLVPLELTEEEKAYLKEKKVLHSLTSEEQPPYSYFKDGEHVGIVADIMELLEKELGVEITAGPIQNMETRRHAMSIGEIDFIADIYDDYNWAAENDVWLTAPYLTLNYVAVTHRDEGLPETPVIACARGHFYNRTFVEKNYPSAQVRYYPTLHDCLQAVNDHEADLLFTKTLTVDNDIYGGGFLNLYTSGNVVFSHKVSIGVSRYADSRLLPILSKAILHIQQQQISGILIRNAHSMEEQGTLYTFIYYHPVKTIGLVALFFLSILLALLIFIWQRHRGHKKIFQMAYTNPLTGLHNMAWLTKELPGLIQEHDDLRKKGKLFLMTVTSDRMSFMKETYDTKLLVKSLTRTLQHQRAENPWLLAYGINSEATCLYLLCQEPEDLTISQAAEKFIRDGSVVNIGRVPTNFTYRIGLASVPPENEVDISWLMDCSYKANQEAVASDQELVIYDEQLAAKISRRQEMERLMHKALAAQEFQVWLQPKYDLATRNTLGAEALVRWDSPELGFLMPYSFMDLFERNGFAVELDYYVLERVCEIQSARLKKGLPALPISVNQSGLHITEQGYLGRMREMMDRWQLIPGLIELEITETAFIDFTTRNQREDAAQIIDDLQDIGFSLSMDDFCTGYSSLSMLQNLPMNVMKIDRSVLWDAEKSPRSMSILHHVIALGKALSMSVLVEGIETEEQEKHLLSLGCDSGQGFFYARPMPVKEFYEEFLPEHS